MAAVTSYEAGKSNSCSVLHDLRLHELVLVCGCAVPFCLLRSFNADIRPVSSLSQSYFFRYPLACEDDDNIELVAADHTEGVSASAVVHTTGNDTDDGDEHVYELGGNGRGTVSGGVLNMMCAATKTSVKVARVQKAVRASDDDAVYPQAVDTEAGDLDLDDDDDDDDDNVYDLSGAAGRTILASEGDAVYPIAAGGDDDDNDDVYNLGNTECAYDCRTTDTDPTYDVLGLDSEESSAI
jgi:hypothetical protein